MSRGTLIEVRAEPYAYTCDLERTALCIIDMQRDFVELDALAMQTSRVAAPTSEDVEQYFLVLSANCIPWSFIGLPAVSIPCGLTAQRLPVGVQLVGAPFDEGTLLSLGSALEAPLDMPILPASSP